MGKASGVVTKDGRELTPIPEREPHFDELRLLFDEKFPRLTKPQIYDKWVELISPDEPQITEKQFVNWTRNVGRKKKEEQRVQEAQEAGLENFLEYQKISMMALEHKVRVGQNMMLEDALDIAQKAKDQPLKERYYAQSVINDTQKTIHKEKDIVLKRQKETRETVGMFAKLAGQAMTGELAIDDVQLLEDVEDNLESNDENSE